MLHCTALHCTALGACKLQYRCTLAAACHGAVRPRLECCCSNLLPSLAHAPRLTMPSAPTPAPQADQHGHAAAPAPEEHQASQWQPVQERTHSHTGHAGCPQHAGRPVRQAHAPRRRGLHPWRRRGRLQVGCVPGMSFKCRLLRCRLHIPLRVCGQVMTGGCTLAPFRAGCNSCF